LPGGKAWAPRAKPRRIRATYTRPHGIRHLMAAYDVGQDRLYGHIKPRKRRVDFLAFCRYLRQLYPHKGDAVRAWAEANNVELAYTPSTARG
jgi:hypothetical protein